MKTRWCLPMIIIYYVAVLVLTLIENSSESLFYFVISIGLLIIILVFHLFYVKKMSGNFQIIFKWMNRFVLITILAQQNKALFQIPLISHLKTFIFGFFFFKYTRPKTLQEEKINLLSLAMRICILIQSLFLFTINFYFQSSPFNEIIISIIISSLYSFIIIYQNYVNFSKQKPATSDLEKNPDQINSIDQKNQPSYRQLFKDQQKPSDCRSFQEQIAADQLESQKNFFQRLFNQFPYGMVEYYNRFLKAIFKSVQTQQCVTQLLNLKNCVARFQEQNQYNDLFKMLNIRLKKKSCRELKQIDDDEELLISSFNLDLETHISYSQNVQEEYQKQIKNAEQHLINYINTSYKTSMKQQGQSPSLYSSNPQLQERLKFICEVKMICQTTIDDEEVKISIQSPCKDTQEQFLEVILKPYIYSGKPYVLVMVRDVTLFNQYSVLQQMNENKSKMLYQVAHEFRTPLNCIILLVEKLIGLLDQSDQTDSSIVQEYNINMQYLKPIQMSADQLLNLANDLLDLAQLKAGKFKLTLKEFEIEADLIKILSIMQTQTHEKGLYLKLILDQELPSKITSDPNRFRQIIMNLIGNAIKFTPTGGISVEVRQASEKLISVIVKDTGVGIDKEDQGKLFTAFSKLERTSNLNAQGVGLGLMISHILAQKLAQEPSLTTSSNNQDIKGLEVSSEGKNQGTTFSYQVFDHSKQQFKSQTKRSKSTCYSSNIVDGMIVYTFPSEDTDHCLKGSRKKFSEDIEMISGQFNLFSCECKEIMIVDDAIFNIIALSKSLEQYRLKLDTANSGDQALEKIEKQFKKECISCKGFKIILMDFQMPIKDGFKTTEEIRKLEKKYKNCSPQYIIGCSAYGESGRDMATNMDDFQEKPVKPKLFLEKIQTIKKKIISQQI